MLKKSFLCLLCAMSYFDFNKPASFSVSQSKNEIVPSEVEVNMLHNIDKEKLDIKIEPKERTEIKDKGLLHYRQYWERVESELLVNGEKISGTPIFIEEGAVRVVNKEHSYFIPLEKIDYIRTNDGLENS